MRIFSYKFKSVRTKLIVSFISVAALLAVLGVFGLAQQSSIAAKGKDIDKARRSRSRSSPSCTRR